MFNWRNKVEKKLEEERRLRQRQEDEVRRQREAQREAKHNEDMKYIRSNFKCYICGKIPNRPLQYEVDIGWGESRTEVDWKSPGDLHKCRFCHRWACDEHLYKEICRDCAKNF